MEGEQGEIVGSRDEGKRGSSTEFLRRDARSSWDVDRLSVHSERVDGGLCVLNDRVVHSGWVDSTTVANASAASSVSSTTSATVLLLIALNQGFNERGDFLHV